MYSKGTAFFTAAFLILILSACAPPAEEPVEEAEVGDQPQVSEQQPLQATAELQPTEGNTATGTVSFEEIDGRVRIEAHVSGLEPGTHGFHIHETGDCSAPDATSAGGHFNPDQTQHGSPEDDVHHAGDLGNLEADEEGNAHLELEVDFITLSEGAHSVMGKAVIVHAGPDDLKTQPTGNAGARLACGVIRSK